MALKLYKLGYFILISIGSSTSCKPQADSSVAGIEREKRGNCSDVNDWEKSPKTCHKDKDQVVVTEVMNLVDGIPSETFRRLKRAGKHICFGKIKYFDNSAMLGKETKEGYGVWLNGWPVVALEGCRKGTGYRNINSGAKGNNAVTPLIIKAEISRNSSGLSTTRQLLFTHKRPSLQIGHRIIEEFPTNKPGFSTVGRKEELEFCTGPTYESKCNMRVSNDTFEIFFD